MGKTERLKTLSKNFYDDEISFISENGDIHLKEGVHRLNYPFLTSDNLGIQINFVDKAMQRIKEHIENNRDWDDKDN